MPKHARKKKTLPSLPSVESPPAVQLHQHRAPDGAVLREAIIERAEWRDPDDMNALSRTPRKVIAFRRVDQLQKLHDTGAGVTDEHLTAARRFMHDAEAADGARPGRDLTGVRVDIAQTGPGNLRLIAIGRYRRAVQAIGQRGSAILALVVLENASVSDLVRRLGVQQHYTALGMLIATLDRLCEHYDGPKREQHAPKQALEAL